MRVSLISKEEAVNGQLGTYGMISGARYFLCTVINEKTNDLDHGIIFQRIILYCTQLGLGTCWMGGTFSAKTFEPLLNLKKGEKLYMVSPVGHVKDEVTMTSRLVSAISGSSLRKPFDVFFTKGLDKNAQDSSFSEAERKSSFIGQCLDAARWAPSALNAQPMRCFVTSKSSLLPSASSASSSDRKDAVEEPYAVHFFGVGGKRTANDVGIAMLNFDKVAREVFHKEGEWIICGKMEHADIEEPRPIGSTGKLVYFATWLQK
eukprot:MONOS_5264.1-p1 / transcript=MONOS_5264.1 / gene=MONOS_5264 / organism=Monocercomonoides_exilis_PA203 / gene_product=nitroreductase / transcript_product=nitroreductase / location=Mono_scaffold00151:65512-66761(+) / protein_length=262 / sequence_SO=supercontig / SO=protein_coding / is_pseudo=false